MLLLPLVLPLLLMLLPLLMLLLLLLLLLLQAFDSDPHEFIHKTNDPSEDYLSPRVPAMNCIIDLAKYRGKDILPKVREPSFSCSPQGVTCCVALASCHALLVVCWGV